MKILTTKKNKKIYIIFLMFILINILLVTPSFAHGNTTLVVKTKVGATILTVLVKSAAICVSGWFTIKLTIAGIQYFTAVAATEKADVRNKLRWTLLYGVLAILGVYLFAYATGVY